MVVSSEERLFSLRLLADIVFDIQITLTRKTSLQCIQKSPKWGYYAKIKT